MAAGESGGSGRVEDVRHCTTELRKSEKVSQGNRWARFHIFYILFFYTVYVVLLHPDIPQRIHPESIPNQSRFKIILQAAMKSSLTNSIALVTGASRGVGKGVALGLGEAGATVYVTGRSAVDLQDAGKLGGTVAATAAAVSAVGGRGVGILCDHRKDEETEAVLGQIRRDCGRLDILVNNAWAGYENMFEAGKFTYTDPFWEQPMWRWDAMFDSGVRAAYVCAAQAARLMTAQNSGLIVNISYWSAQRYLYNTAYGVAKAAIDKMTEYMALELRPYNVAVVSLYPGLVRTESVLRSAALFDLSNSESPQFIGRAVAALACDPALISKSGKVLVAAELGLEYGFTDLDGSQPRPLAAGTAV
jgi:NAD(P)-dependent dehydrogenase (short-subunit alcohol dehydrogenase family)